MDFPGSANRYYKNYATENEEVDVIFDNDFEDGNGEDGFHHQDQDDEEMTGTGEGGYSVSGSNTSYLPQGSMEIETVITDFVYKPDGKIDEIKVKTNMTVYQAFVRAAEKSFYKCMENGQKWTEEAIIPELMFQTPFCNIPETYLRQRVKTSWKRLATKARQAEATALKTGMGDLGARRKATPDDLLDDKVMDILQRSSAHNKQLVAASLAKEPISLKMKNKDKAELAQKLRAQATYGIRQVSASKKIPVVKNRAKPSSTATSASSASKTEVPKLHFKRLTKKSPKLSNVFDEELQKQVIVSDDDEDEDVEGPEDPFATRREAIENEVDQDGYSKADMMECIRRYIRGHSLKFINVSTAQGLVLVNKGPYEGRLHDSTCAEEEDLYQLLTDLLSFPQNNWYALAYGDSAFTNRVPIVSSYAPAFNDEQKKFNKDMSKPPCIEDYLRVPRNSLN